MAPKKVGPIGVAQAWLNKHSRSRHTRRKYEAQFQQLCEWLLVKNLDLLSVETITLKEYLDHMAQGTLQLSDGNPPKARSPRTVALSCSVLRSLFRELVASGLRSSNPMDQLAPRPNSHATVYEKKRTESSNDWIYRRKLLSDARPSRQNGQLARLRAVVVAELAYWVGLRRSEIANASMADILVQDSGWVIKVKKFGNREINIVGVPEQVMRAIVEYRLARKLDEEPKSSEKDVPLIAHLKSERFVNPWTVANALLLLDGSTSDFSIEKRHRSIIALRRELIQRSLAASVAAESLSRHLRSEYTVRQIERDLPSRPVIADLERLAA